jgi:hypothetical protein
MALRSRLEREDCEDDAAINIQSLALALGVEEGKRR